MDLCRSPPCQLLQEVTLHRPLSDISAAALWHTERSLPLHVAEKRRRLKHYSSKTKACLIKYICDSSLHEGFCCDRHVSEGSWASISSHAGKGNCIWAIWVYPSLSCFHFLILHWNLMLKHHFLRNIWEMWDMISDCDSVFFLTSRPQVLVSGWWTGCPLNHCIHGESHTFR